jgi:hypothetical protein
MAFRSAVTLLLSLFGTPLAAPQNPNELLSRVRRKIVETVNRLPKYVCTQTVERKQSAPAAAAGGKSKRPNRRSEFHAIPIWKSDFAKLALMGLRPMPPGILRLGPIPVSPADPAYNFVAIRFRNCTALGLRPRIARPRPVFLHSNPNTPFPGIA